MTHTIGRHAIGSHAGGLALMGWACLIGLLPGSVIQAEVTAPSPRPIQLPGSPAVSPDGSRIAFHWLGDIWSAAADGSDLTRLTNHPADDWHPVFSPDGQQIAFVSDRTGSSQIHLMDVTGSAPRQVTFHTAGYDIADWFPDGQSILAIGARDHFWRGAQRMIRIDLTTRRQEQIVADCTASDAKLSPDGTKVLFVREGERWWRKGYQGERAAQIWLLDLKTGQYQELLHEGVDCRWPIWRPDGDGFYFTKGAAHGFDLWQYLFPTEAEQTVSTDAVSTDAGSPETDSDEASEDGTDSKGQSTDAAEETKPATPSPKPVMKQIAGFEDDSIVFPAIARDGSVIVFRHLFDLYRMKPGSKDKPVKISLAVTSDTHLPDDRLRRTHTRVEDVAFTDDGLEIAFVAGGDVWVMDTKLREPIRVTATDGYEGNVLFSPDAKSLYFTSVREGQTDIWRAVRADEKKYWWQNQEFRIEQVTDSADVESDLRFTPDGKTLVFQHGRGDLVAMTLESGEIRTITSSFSGIEYDIAADGRWIAFSQQDEDFNRDIWLTRLDRTIEPVNVSRHPDNEGNPRLSPDGKILAFTGRRVGDELDIHYVYLQAKEDQKSSRQRQLEEALELMAKKRRADEPPKSAEPKTGDKPESDKPDGAKPDGAKPDGGKSDETKPDGDKPSPAKPASDASGGTKPFTIDVDKIHERIRTISIPNSSEGNLIWSPDSKKLYFTAEIEGKRGIYSVEFPDKLKPSLVTTSLGGRAVWPKKAGAMLYVQEGQPARLDPTGRLEKYSFSVAQESSRSGRLKAGFEAAWQTMREVWYDERFAGRNWDAIRRKYADAAGQGHDESALAEVIELMLGELNGSHLGFTPRRSSSSSSFSDGWREETAHLGVRFVADHAGPGLKVRDVLPGGPADRAESQLKPGDVILGIDGTPVDPDKDLTEILNGRLDRDIVLRVQRPTKAKPTDEKPADKKPADDKKDNDKKDNGESDKKSDDTKDGDTKDGEKKSDGQESDGKESDETKKAKPEEITVTIRPISYGRARSLLYDHWLEHNRQLVDKLSDGKLGYLHIQGMNMPSFYEFQRQLYNVGYGRQGLIIDVRDNGGGSTTDHLLTALTQPRHAITVPRGGQPGYPHDRTVYASWHKPIIVLCNQNSYSNAEIFSHAIKTLGRGKVVGVQTAGGVVSTGAASVMDLGTIRVPFRGWFVLDTGEDMEMNGAKPDVVIWPAPGELPQGTDHQLGKAVELLLEEVADEPEPPKLRYAAERDAP